MQAARRLSDSNCGGGLVKNLRRRLEAIEEETRYLVSNDDTIYFTLTDLETGREGIVVYRGKIYKSYDDIPRRETAQTAYDGTFEMPALMTPEMEKKLLEAGKAGE
jgi:hypothetical protein